MVGESDLLSFQSGGWWMGPTNFSLSPTNFHVYFAPFTFKSEFCTFVCYLVFNCHLQLYIAISVTSQSHLSLKFLDRENVDF